MRFSRVMLSFILSVGAFNGSYVLGAPLCSDVFVDISRSAQIKTYEELFKRAETANKRIYPVLESFINDAKKDQLILPDDLLGDSEGQIIQNSQFAKKWIKNIKKEAKATADIKIDDDDIRAMGKGASEVYRVNLSLDKRVIFRPGVVQINASIPGRFDSQDGGNITVIRKTMLAFKMNRWFELKSTPDSWVGSLNGQVGVFSEYIPYQIKESDWSYLVHKKPNHSYSNFYDVDAFEFLIGNYEAHWGFNILTRTPNQLTDNHQKSAPALPEIDPVIIDHDPAFIPGLSYESLSHVASTGTNLPMYYTKSFIAHLRALTPEILTQRMSLDATPVEIRGVIFRRALILRDIEINGASVIIP